MARGGAWRGQTASDQARMSPGSGRDPKGRCLRGHHQRRRWGEDPDVPAALDDRAADGWEPLLAIADAAGGHWPRSARLAAVALSADRNSPDDGTPGVRLLADVRIVFRGERMTSPELTAALVELEPSSWGDLRGKPLSQHVLSRMLGDYGVPSKSIRLPDGSTPKGYERRQFEDAS